MAIVTLFPVVPAPRIVPVCWADICTGTIWEPPTTVLHELYEQEHAEYLTARLDAL